MEEGDWRAYEGAEEAIPRGRESVVKAGAGCHHLCLRLSRCHRNMPVRQTRPERNFNATEDATVNVVQNR